MVNRLIHDMFARPTSETNPAVDSLFLFTARPFYGERKYRKNLAARVFAQDSQLQNNLNRWYDARVGRWTFWSDFWDVTARIGPLRILQLCGAIDLSPESPSHFEHRCFAVRFQIAQQSATPARQSALSRNRQPAPNASREVTSLLENYL